MDVVCNDPEGWRLLSPLRPFDSTPCFEEGVIQSSLLAALVAASLIRSLGLAVKPPLERSFKSCSLLWLKIVSTDSLLLDAYSFRRL